MLTPQQQLTVLMEGVFNSNESIRNQAVNQLNLIRDQNLGEYLLEVSKKISNEEEKKEIRQMSATIIKNTITTSPFNEKWFSLPEDLKQNIKKNVLSTLASNEIQIRKAAALALAGICKIEIPKGEWLNIFDVLCGTCENQNLYIKLSSLTTLEYIYEEIKKGDIPNEIVAKLLNTYYILLKNKSNSEDPQLIINTLLSLQKFLPFIGDFLKDDKMKNEFFKLIEEKIVNVNYNENIRGQGLYVFLEIGRLYYDSYNNYISTIFNITKVIIEKDVDKNKFLCFELWNTIAEEEDNRINNEHPIKKPLFFLQNYYNDLSDLCLKNILTEDYNNENEEYTTDKASLNLLYNLGRCCNFEFISKMLNYISLNINSNSEKNRFSAYNVFHCIIPNKNKKQFYIIIKDSLATFADILIGKNYPNYLKILSAKIIKTITQEYAEFFINDVNNFDKLIELFLNLITSQQNKEIVLNNIHSIHNLVKNIKWFYNDETNVFSKHMQRVCEPLLKLATDLSLYDENCNITIHSLQTIGSIAEKCTKNTQPFMISLFNHLIEVLQSTLEVKNFPNEEIRSYYQSNLCACITGFLTSEAADKNSTGKLLDLVLTSLRQKNGIYEEALSLISSIALFTKGDFSVVMQNVAPIFINGLRALDSPAICKNSIYSLSDIIRGLEKKFSDYVKDFLPLVMNIFSSPAADRILKPQCFIVISDLFISCPSEALKSFDDIMKIIGSAITATQNKFKDDSDIENIKYFIELREHLIETITCIFTSITEIQKTKEFIPYVNPIVTYIKNICEDEYAYSEEIIRTGLLLIADFCHAYGNEIKAILDIEWVKKMMEKINKIGEKSLEQEILDQIDYIKQKLYDTFN